MGFRVLETLTCGQEVQEIKPPTLQFVNFVDCISERRWFKMSPCSVWPQANMYLCIFAAVLKMISFVLYHLASQCRTNVQLEFLAKERHQSTTANVSEAWESRRYSCSWASSTLSPKMLFYITNLYLQIHFVGGYTNRNVQKCKMTICCLLCSVTFATCRSLTSSGRSCLVWYPN